MKRAALCRHRQLPSRGIKHDDPTEVRKADSGDAFAKSPVYLYEQVDESLASDFPHRHPACHWTCQHYQMRLQTIVKYSFAGRSHHNALFSTVRTPARASRIGANNDGIDLRFSTICHA